MCSSRYTTLHGHATNCSYLGVYICKQIRYYSVLYGFEFKILFKLSFVTAVINQIWTWLLFFSQFFYLFKLSNLYPYMKLFIFVFVIKNITDNDTSKFVGKNILSFPIQILSFLHKKNYNRMSIHRELLFKSWAIRSQPFKILNKIWNLILFWSLKLLKIVKAK